MLRDLPERPIKGRGVSTKNVVGFGGPGKAVSLLRQQE